MPNYSARDMLLRMAHGGPVHTPSGEPVYGKGATAADLLAAEQRVLGEIANDPSSWDVETAYNAILESGVTIDDALAAGVKQETIDAIFTSPTARTNPTYITPSTVESSFTAYAPYANMTQEEIAANAKQYLAGLTADGVIDQAEKREMQRIATERGVTFQDFLDAGVSPELLFYSPELKKKDDDKKVDEIFKEVDTDTGTGADSATGVTVYDPAGFGTDPGIYAPGQEALDRVFRDSAPRTEVIEDVMGTPQLTGFDYTPAAKLLSATGSGFSFTPPSVTGRPRSLMDTGTLNRYTRGRSAQDLRQLVGGDQARYDQYSGLLNNRGSYGGGLSRSQLYALTRQQDSQRRATGVSASTGTISDYLRLNPDIGVDYARAQAAGELPAGTTAESFALNHYNTLGRSEIEAGTRAPFTLAQGTDRTSPIAGGNNYFSAGMGGFEGEGDSNFTTRGYDNELLARDLGAPGGAIIRPVFAEGGLVKKPKGSASTDLETLGKYAGGGLIDKAIQKGAEALGFDDERQVAISQEAVDLTNQMVDAGLIGEQYRVELLIPKDASKRTRQNTGIKGDEEVFNAVNHALFAYDAGQNPLSSIGAQAKEVYQGLNRKMGGSDPRSEYLDYFNNKFGFNLAKQGLSRQEAKNAIMDTLGNINNQGTRGRMMRGEPVQAGQDLLTNVKDAKYPWE